MDHSAVDDDNRATVKVTKDKNGVEQVLLQNPRGASARVGSLTAFGESVNSVIKHLLLK